MVRFEDPGADPALVQRLVAFINADDWREKRSLAEQHPELATEETSQLLERWIAAVGSQGDGESVAELRRYADFLALLRTHGVSTTFEAAAESAARDGHAALQRFQDSDTPDAARAALDDAARSFATALAASTRTDRSAWFDRLGLVYSERFDRAGDPDDLNLAVDLGRRALEDTAPNASSRASQLTNLATYLLDRHDAGAGTADDLAAAEETAGRAVDAARRAARPTAAPPPAVLAAAWLVRARAAMARFDDRRDPTRLADAIDAARTALEVATTDRDRAAGSGTLGNALLSRYAVRADPDELDSAVTHHRRALRVTTTPSAQAIRLSNLGIALLTRYDRTGDIGDINEAIDVLERASDLTPATASSAGAVSTNLGLVLAERYERRRAGDDLARAVAAFGRAVDLTPDRAVQRPWTLLNLGGGLIDLYEQQRHAAHLDAAVGRLAEGLALLPADSTDTAAFHNRLSAALRLRADGGGTPDVDRAVEAARRAVDVTAPDSPQLPGWLEGLAAALRARYGRTGEEPDRREASEAYRRAAELGILSDPGTALRAALAWQSWTLGRGDGTEAASATGLAVRALRALVAAQLLRGDKETWLRDAEGLTGRAALALTSVGDGPAAVLAVETCRAVLLDEALQTGESGVRRLDDDGHHELALRLRQALGRASVSSCTIRS